MKKKKLNQILLILVLIIYSGLVTKYFTKNETVRAKSLVNYPFQIKKKSKNKISRSNDFELIVLEKDPFLGEIKIEAQKNIEVINKNIAYSSNSKSIVKWPKIEYFGFLKANSHSRRRAVLKVNDKRYNKLEKERVRGLLIKEIYSDSLVLYYKGSKQTFMK